MNSFINRMAVLSLIGLMSMSAPCQGNGWVLMNGLWVKPSCEQQRTSNDSPLPDGWVLVDSVPTNESPKADDWEVLGDDK